jgi:ATP/ADP translocase
MKEFLKEKKYVLFFGILLLFQVGYIAGWAGVYSFLISKTDANNLPYYFIFSALGSFFINIISAFFSDIFKKQNIIRVSQVVFSLILCFEIFVIKNEGLFSANTLFSILLILSILIISIPSIFSIQIWTLINENVAPSNASKVYPILGSANIIASITGGIIANIVPKYFSNIYLIFIWLLTMILSFGLVSLIKSNYEKPENKRNFKTLINNFKDGAKYYIGSSFIKYLSVTFISFWLVNTLTYFYYSQFLVVEFQSPEKIASFMGLFTIITQLSALVMQFFIAPKIIKKIGVIKGFLYLPVSQIVGLSLIVIYPQFWAIILTEFMQDLIGMSVQANSVNMAFNVISSKVRAKIRTFLEGIINPLGGVIAGVMILIIQKVLPSSEFINYHIPLFGIIFAGIWVFAAIQLRFYYLQEMKKSFKINKNNDRIFIKESLMIEKNAKRKK